MASLKLGTDFTTEEGSKPIEQETVQPVETGPEPEPETETPSEPPAEEKPGEIEISTEDTKKPGPDQEPVKNEALDALREERAKLLTELADLRGQRRELKEKQVERVEQAIDELKDVHPDDVTVVEKIIRAKGFVTKAEAQTMFYESVKQEELNKFLSKYPEYKPENDSKDINWSSLQAEMSYFARPEDPHKIGELLERAHRAITRVSGGRDTQRKLEVAQAGAGAGSRVVQRPSSGRALDPDDRIMLKRGGWSEEEIKDIEADLK